MKLSFLAFFAAYTVIPTLASYNKLSLSPNTEQRSVPKRARFNQGLEEAGPALSVTHIPMISADELNRHQNKRVETRNVVSSYNFTPNHIQPLFPPYPAMNPSYQQQQPPYHHNSSPVAHKTQALGTTSQQQPLDGSLPPMCPVVPNARTTIPRKKTRSDRSIVTENVHTFRAASVERETTANCGNEEYNPYRNFDDQPRLVFRPSDPETIMVGLDQIMTASDEEKSLTLNIDDITRAPSQLAPASPQSPSNNSLEPRGAGDQIDDSLVNRAGNDRRVIVNPEMGPGIFVKLKMPWEIIQHTSINKARLVLFNLPADITYETLVNVLYPFEANLSVQQNLKGMSKETFSDKIQIFIDPIMGDLPFAFVTCSNQAVALAVSLEILALKFKPEAELQDIGLQRFIGVDLCPKAYDRTARHLELTFDMAAIDPTQVNQIISYRFWRGMDMPLAGSRITGQQILLTFNNSVNMGPAKQLALEKGFALL